MTVGSRLDPCAVGIAFERFTALRAVVVGDVMLDETIVGSVGRLSPEAPVPVLLTSDRFTGLGGAANVARQLVAFGATVDLFGVVGADESARLVTEACDEAGIHGRLIEDPGRPTTRKSRFLAHHHHLLRVDHEDQRPMSDSVRSDLVGAVSATVRPDVVVLSDHDKGVLHPDLLKRVFDVTRSWDVPVLVDPKSADLERYGGATVIKANLREFEVLTGSTVDAADLERIGVLSDRVMAVTGCSGVIVTLSGAGMVVAAHGDGPIRIPAVDVTAADTSGAGDIVIAAMALGLASGLELGSAAEVANLAAGLAVTRSGINVLGLIEVADGLCPERPGVIDSHDDLVGLVKIWRAAGRRIIMANGCFDLLHAGHLRLLEHAARLGDVLVIAVDDDSSVRAAKGEGRPVVAAAERAKMLAALHCVDAVVVFGHDELLPLIDRVRPDRLVKGADYSVDEVVGREVVEAAGGVVELVPLLDGESTSDIVRRLGGRNRTSISDGGH